MIKLMNLLTECFYTSQWLDIFQKYPEIVELFKNDPITQKRKYFINTKVKWDDLHQVAYVISNFGGHCGLGPEDFNYNRVANFLSNAVHDEDSKEDNNITKKTLNKILPLVKNYFEKYGDNTSKESELNWIKTEYNRLLNKFGEEKANNWLNVNIKLGNHAWKKFKITKQDILNALK